MRRTAHQTKARAPISFFDSLLMSHATGDLVLAARINALVDSGRLECRGESPLHMLSSEVRLPQLGG